MDDTFRTQWTITPHLPDESSALVDETHRRTQNRYQQRPAKIIFSGSLFTITLNSA